MLKNKTGPHRLAEPVFLEHCMESFLGKALPGRNDQKPIQILKELEQGGITTEKLDELNALFLKALALSAFRPEGVQA